MLSNDAAALRHILVDVLHQSQARLFLVSYLDDTHSIQLLYTEFLERLAHDVEPLPVLIKRCRGAIGRHNIPMQIVEQTIFLHQVVERLATCFLLSTLLTTQEKSAQRHEHDDANGNDDKAHWHEREEAERLIASLGQHLVDDKVGRSTDKRKHSAQTTCKGKGHEET